MNQAAFVGTVLIASATSAFAAADQPRKTPVKIFILAGQSNMEGQAVVDLDGKDYNEGKGTLKALLNDPAKRSLFKHLKNDKGQWTMRDDVWVRFQPENGPLKAGPLTLGFSPYAGKHHFGPELQFGHVVGDHLRSQILLIKTAWGGKSLYKDFRPPSSSGDVGPYYTKMLTEVRQALANLKTDFPGYKGQGYEFAGFVWYHGWNDGVDPKHAVPEYEQNLVNLIKDVRKDLKAPKLPVVIGELTGPWVQAPGAWATLRKAQAKAAGRAEFKGNVIFVETHNFVRLPENSPNPGHGHHEFGNAETYYLVGDALGKGMVKLLAFSKAGDATKEGIARNQDYWPRFRGPHADGVAADDARLPDTWDKKKNVKWVAEIPGWGLSCPIVWGDKVFVTTVVSDGDQASPKKGLYLGQGVRTPAKGMHHWLVYCFDLKSGKELWKHEAHKGEPKVPRHPKSGYAAETPTTDGKRLYVLFGDLGLYCYGLDGKPLWAHMIEPKKTFLDYGAAASPVVHDDQVFVLYDNQERSYLASFDAATGKQRSRTSARKRPRGRRPSSGRTSCAPRSSPVANSRIAATTCPANCCGSSTAACRTSSFHRRLPPTVCSS